MRQQPDPPEAASEREKATAATAERDAAFSASLPCAADSAVVARQRAVLACLAWYREELCEAVGLVTTELVANAVRHARSAIRLSLRPTTAGMRVEVADDSPRMPLRRDPGPYDETGRGLWLVDAVAARWGVEAERPGKRVWAELDPE